MLSSLSASASLPQYAEVLPLTVELLPFQREGVQFMISRERDAPGGGILADDMGLGKTVQLTALMLAHPAPPPTELAAAAADGGLCPCGATLVVVPASIVDQWARELERLAPQLNVVRFNGTTARKGAPTVPTEKLASADIVLVTYECLRSEAARVARGEVEVRTFRHGRQSDAAPSALRLLKFWRVVLDEVQFAQDGKKHGQVVRQVAAVHRWAVSGTPARATAFLDDCEQLVDFVRGPTWKASSGWRELVDAVKAGPDESDSGAADDAGAADAAAADAAAAMDTTEVVKAEAALVALLSPFFLRRTKAQVASQLRVPPHSATHVHVALSPAEQALQTHFVLPAAAEHASCGLKDATLLASRAARLSLHSPSLFAAWGRKGHGADQLVGALSCHKESEQLWNSLLSAANADLEAERRALAGLTSEALGTKEPSLTSVTEADLAKLRLLAAVSTIGVLGRVGGGRSGGAVLKKACVADSDDPPLDLHLAMGLVFAYLADEYVQEWRAEVRGLPAHHHDVGHRLTAIRTAYLIDTFPIGREHLTTTLTTLTTATPKEAVRPTVAAGDVKAPPLACPLGAGTRWAHMQPLLGIDAAVAYAPTFEGDDDLVHPSHARTLRCSRRGTAVELVHLLALALSDVGRELDAMRTAAEGVLLPLGGWQRSSFLIDGPYADQGGWRRCSGVRSLSDSQLHNLMRCAHEQDVAFSRQEPALAHILWWNRYARRGDAPIALHELQQRLHDAAASARARLDGNRAARAQAGASRLDAGLTRLDRLHARQQSVILERMLAQARGQQADDGSSSRHVAESAKQSELLRMLEGGLGADGRGIGADEKVVVVSNFAEALPMLSKLLASRGHRSVSLGSSSAQRSAAVSTFRDSPACRVFLLHAATAAGATGSGAAGLNLTSANHVLLLDELLNLELERQVVGRVCRFGQVRPTTVWHLLGAGSVDEPLRVRAEVLAAGATGAAGAAGAAAMRDDDGEIGGEGGDVRAALAEAARRAVSPAETAHLELAPLRQSGMQLQLLALLADDVGPRTHSQPRQPLLPRMLLKHRAPRMSVR